MTVAFLYFRITLGLLFLVAGLMKVGDRRAFQLAVASFQIVPSHRAASVATLILCLELAGSGLLLAGVYEWLGAFLLGLLLLALTVALVVNLRRGRRNLDCRCFGQPTVGIGWGHVIQNVLLLAIAVSIAVAALRGHRSSGWGDLTSGFLTILAALYTAALFLAAQEFVSVRAGLVRVLTRGVQRG
jgi:uncharacterized membrane protein YphA (DoxX/SURF4 family)